MVSHSYSLLTIQYIHKRSHITITVCLWTTVLERYGAVIGGIEPPLTESKAVALTTWLNDNGDGLKSTVNYTSHFFGTSWRKMLLVRNSIGGYIRLCSGFFQMTRVGICTLHGALLDSNQLGLAYPLSVPLRCVYPLCLPIPPPSQVPVYIVLSSSRFRVSLSVSAL